MPGCSFPPPWLGTWGLPQLVQQCLDLGNAPGRANTGDKIMTLVASALAGGDCIDDADVLRTGGTARTLGSTVKAPIHPGDLPAQLPVGPCQPTGPGEPEPENSPATGAPGITGTARVGETLTADTSSIADADGLSNASFSYQWLADETEIEGATDSGYTLGDADEGKAVSVKVSFSDDAGNQETLTSAATAAVEASPTPPPAPTNLTAVVNQDGSVTLTWDAPDDDSVTGYLILRRRPYEGEKTLLVYVENTGSTATTWTDTNVTAGTQHVYRVKAINAAGAGRQSNYVNVDP